ncbi:MAG: protein kinase [Anaerolineae bacterium]
MSIYTSRTLIANRYEVVQGPREKPSLAGGIGIVYLCADQTEQGRPVALKTFKPEYLPDRAARERFLQEGTAWVELGRHPHIVRAYRIEYISYGLEVYIVLEWVAEAEGKRDASLRAWLRPSKPLPVEQALLFALHIARGMKHATMKLRGLVHRDLKPENVLVGHDENARVTDFGLAGIIGDLSGTMSGQYGLGRQKRSVNLKPRGWGVWGLPTAP